MSESVNNPDRAIHEVVVMGAASAGRKEIKPGNPWVQKVKSIRLFGAVLILMVVASGYYGMVASDRYAVETQFVIKESGAQVELSGLASLGAVSATAKDALVIKAFIESREMAEQLDKAIGLKAHFQTPDIDFVSRLPQEATSEMYLQYYLDLITVYHDEMSDIVRVEVQAFTPEFALLLGNTILEISEKFINELGDKMAKEQVRYAESEVERTHKLLKEWQRRLLVFQDKNRLFNPEQESGAILNGINELQLQSIKAEARLKELTAVMREDSPEVLAQKNLIRSLQQQLAEERQRMTDESGGGFSKINLDFQEITLGAELAGELYKSSLVSLDAIRSQALQKLKHVLVVEAPLLPQESKYPDRIYNIISWFIALMIAYFIVRMVIAVIKEHRD